MTPEWLLRFAAEAHEALRNRERDPIGIAERAAIYAPQPRDPNPYEPHHSDAIRDGLLKGWNAHRNNGA